MTGLDTMQISKIARNAALGFGLVAANMVPFVAAANAADRHSHLPRGYGYQNGYRHGHIAPNHRYRSADHYRSRRHDGAGIALGIGALIIGGMIAAEAARRDRHADVD